MRLLIAASSACLVLAAGGVAVAQQFTPCEGPFRHCAAEVQAMCHRESDGEQVIAFKDALGKAAQFERCVGNIYQQRGLPNPYVTGVASDDLPLPKIELQQYRW